MNEAIAQAIGTIPPGFQSARARLRNSFLNFGSRPRVSSPAPPAAAAFGTSAGAGGITGAACPGPWAPGRVGAAGICGRKLVFTGDSRLPWPSGWVLWLSCGTK